MISPLDVPTLAHNLYNLYISAEQDLEPTPSEDGRVLYVTGFIWNLYELYYCGRNGEVKKVRAKAAAIELTHRSLHYHVSREWGDAELFDYSTYLSRLVKMVLLLNKPVIGRNEEETPTGLIASCHKKIKSRIFLRRFEVKTNYSIPYEALKKLPEMHMIYRTQPWVEHLNSRSRGESWFWERWMGTHERISCRDVHRMIKIVADRLFFDPDGLMYQLRYLGCTVFDDPDSGFLQNKRARWIDLQTIRWKGNEIPLGHQIKGWNQQQTLIYKVRKKRQFVVLSDNTVRLKLNRIEHHLLWDQVSTPPITFHEPTLCGDGFQVFAQFDHRMTSVPWTSKKYSKVYAETLIDFVWHMIRNHYTPRKLSLGSLGWIDGQLMTAESVMMDEPAHIPLLGKYIWEWTKGAPKVYRRIMNATRLDTSVEQEFFEQILIDIKESNERTLWEMTREENYLGEAAFQRSLHWVSTHGASFQKQAKKLAADIGIETVINIYREKGALGFLDPEWFDDTTRVHIT